MAALWRLMAEDGRTAVGPTLGPHFAPKAKNVIYLFMSGAPSQLDLFDPKPKMKEPEDDAAILRGAGRGEAPGQGAEQEEYDRSEEHAGVVHGSLHLHGSRAG